MAKKAAREGREGEGEHGDLNGVSGVRNGAERATRPFGPGLKDLSRRSSEVRHRVDEWSETIRQHARQHPGRSVALALGAGYVLGGGLFSALTARLVGAAIRIGLRVAVVPLVTDGIAALGEGLLGQGFGTKNEEEGAGAPPGDSGAAVEHQKAD